MAPGLADLKCEDPPFPSCFSLADSHPPDASLGFFIVSGLITAARLGLRLQKRMFWWDDFWAVVSLAFYTAFVPGKPGPLSHLPASF